MEVLVELGRKSFMFATKIMYIQITVIVVASAFPLVHIPYGDKFEGFEHTSSNVSPTNAGGLEQSTTKKMEPVSETFVDEEGAENSEHHFDISSKVKKRSLKLESQHKGREQLYLSSTSKRRFSRKNPNTIHGMRLMHSRRFDCMRGRKILKKRIQRHRRRHEQYSKKKHYNLGSALYSSVGNLIQIQNVTRSSEILYMADDLQEDEQEVIRNGYFETSFSSKYGCHGIVGYEHKWILSIDKCSPGWYIGSIRELCMAEVDVSINSYDINMLPVQSANGTLYKNRYCAMCNFAFKPKHWEIHVDCDRPSKISFRGHTISIGVIGDDDTSPNCLFTVEPPTKKYPIKSCQLRDKRKTHTDWAPLAASAETYPISFSVLMNFGFDGKTHIMFSTTEQEKLLKARRKCKDGEIFDPGKNVCRTVTCSSGFSLKEDMCVRSGSSLTYNETDIDEANFSNIHALTNLDRVAVISLEVNVTYDDVGLALYALEFKPLMVEKIARLLNISSDRIQNFSIAFLNQSEASGHHIRVQTINKEEFNTENENSKNFMKVVNELKEPKLDSSDPVDDDPSTELNNAFEILTTVKESDVTESLINYKQHKTDDSKQEMVMDTTTKVSPIVYVSETDSLSENSGNTLPITTQTGSSRSSTSDIHESVGSEESAQSTTLESTETTRPKHWQHHGKNKTNHRVLNPQILQMTFILLPARTEDSKVSVSQIIAKMNNLLNQNTFKIDMNGTTFNIVNVNNSVETEEKSFCKFGIKDVFFDNEFTLVKVNDTDTNTTINNVYIPSTNSWYKPGQYDVTVLVEGSMGKKANVTDVAGYVFVCVNPRISERECARISIVPEEYVLFENKSLLFYNEVYGLSEYAVLDEDKGTLEICVPDLYYKSEKQHRMKHWIIQECYDGFQDYIKAEGYLTAIIGRLSIIALVSVLITYCLFRSLRNLPGINTMNLTFALFVGEVLFLEGESSDTPWVCKFVAISVHYFFLASFFWMNVMSYDVYKTFANKCILTRIRKTRKFMPRYALYAWGVPALIVAICVFFEFSEMTERLRIGYGGSGLVNVANDNTTEIPDGFGKNDSLLQQQHSGSCWIQSPVAALVAFGAPVLFIFVINIAFFVRTIICIQATAKLAHINTRRTFSHMTGRNDVMLYVRMSTVMGFTWIFGLASSIVSGLFTPPDHTVCLSLHILSILFTICICAQGLFIFFAFVFKKRVFYLYRGLFRKLKIHFERRKSQKLRNSSSSSAASVDSMLTNISHISR